MQQRSTRKMAEKPKRIKPASIRRGVPAKEDLARIECKKMRTYSI